MKTMKSLKQTAALCCALALAGCGAAPVQPNAALPPGNAFTRAIDYLASPTFSQAAQNVSAFAKAGATVVICDLSALSNGVQITANAIASAQAAAVDPKSPLGETVKWSTTVAVGSTTACQLFNGTYVATATVSSAKVTSTPAATTATVTVTAPTS